MSSIKCIIIGFFMISCQSNKICNEFDLSKLGKKINQFKETKFYQFNSDTLKFQLLQSTIKKSDTVSNGIIYHSECDTYFDIKMIDTVKNMVISKLFYFNDEISNQLRLKLKINQSSCDIEFNNNQNDVALEVNKFKNHGHNSGLWIKNVIIRDFEIQAFTTNDGKLWLLTIR